MTAAILAVTIFALMFILIVTEKFERHYITLVSGLLTLVLVFGVAMHDLGAVWKTLNFAEIGTVAFWYHVGASESLSTGINWATIFFIAGICLIVVVLYFALLLRRQISSKTVDYKKLEGIRSHGGPIAVCWHRRPYWLLQCV